MKQLFLLYSYPRSIMAGLSSLGTVITAYLTIVKLNQGNAICPTEGCEKVLSSPYASFNGIPLSLLGCLAYLSIIALAIFPLLFKQNTQKNLKQWTKLPLLIVTGIMSIISSYLIYLLVYVIQSVCIYCLVSAGLSFSLFLLSVFGFSWEDIGELLFILTVVGFITLVAILGWHSSINNSSLFSSTEKIALAQYLNQVEAKMYGAFWCNHCQQQKELFGKEAFNYLNYIECDPSGENAQPQLCQEARIEGYPTWEINGNLFPGVKSLNDLAHLSNYSGEKVLKF